MDFGGVNGCFQTPMNTLGIGDPVPYGIGTVGSGDLFYCSKNTKPAAKKQASPYNFGDLPLIVMANKKN